MERETLFIPQGADSIRIPSLTASPDGTMHAFANVRVGTAEDHAEETKLLYARKPLGAAWEDPRMIGEKPGWSYMIGSAVCDDTTGTVMLLYRKIAAVQPEFGKTESPEDRAVRAKALEERDGMREGDYILETRDGVHFTDRPVRIAPSPAAHGGFVGSQAAFSHGCGSGFTLHSGPFAGRLIVPARMSLHEVRTWEDLKTGSTDTILYSDDHGLSFQSGGVVCPGTGEGCAVERSDGSIYYNSRAYFGDGLRRSAVSADGGVSFAEQHVQEDLIEPCCNADMTAAWDAEGRHILFFSNPHSCDRRERMTIHYSLDEGATWQLGLTLDDKPAAYSSLSWNPVDKRLYMIFECGEDDSVERMDAASFTIDEAMGL